MTQPKGAPLLPLRPATENQQLQQFAQNAECSTCQHMLRQGDPQLQLRVALLSSEGGRHLAETQLQLPFRIGFMTMRSG